MAQLQQSTHIYQIESLKKQVHKYKQESLFWQQKYNALAEQHNQLISVLKNKQFFENDIKNFPQCEETSFINPKQNIKQQASLELIEDQEDKSYSDFVQQSLQKDIFKLNLKQIQPQRFKAKVDPFEAFASQVPNSTLPTISHMTEPEDQFSPLHRLSPKFKQNEQEIDFFCIQQIQKHKSFEQQVKQDQQESRQTPYSTGLNLIEGFFILQKIDNFKLNIKNYNSWIKNCNETTFSQEKNLLEIVYRYTFRQEPLCPMDDDPYDSRVNEIKYGTPYEDLLYSFDNFLIQNEQQEDSRFMKKSMRKKFIHCLIRPQVVYVNGKPFETQIMYGFISPFPFKTFFQDLHRTLQRMHLSQNVEQIKFQILKSNKNIPEEVQVSKDKRIKIVSVLMKDLFEYCDKNCSNIQNFPIKLNVQTKVSVIKLDVQSQQNLNKMQAQSLQVLLKKYNLSKISKVLHYILSQNRTIVVGSSRKHLNQIHQIIRLMIKPFYWVFPIVYRYSDHFEPFLSSPMPLTIGIVFDFNNKNYKQNQILMKNQFVTIFVQVIIPQKDSFFFFSSNKPKYIASDLRQVSDYERDIQFLIKYLNKVDKNSRSNSSQRISKYVNKLKTFIKCGKIQSELSNFMIDFMDTQMVQYYKDVIVGRNKKQNQKQDQYNESMAMTR